MAELPLPRKDHRYSPFIRGGNHLAIANRTAGLNDRRYTGVGRLVDAVAEGEIRVGTEHGAFRFVSLLLSLVHREKRRVDA